MRITRVLVCCLVMCLLSASIFGAVNQQKIYSLDSDVYEALEALYIHHGSAASKRRQRGVIF